MGMLGGVAPGDERCNLRWGGLERLFSGWMGAGSPGGKFLGTKMGDGRCNFRTRHAVGTIFSEFSNLLVVNLGFTSPG